MAEPQASALQYAWPEGRLELREWIAARLRARGADLGADDVIVTSGAQQAIAIAAQLTFRRGDEVGVDPETYPAALDLFRSRGGRPRTGWDAATPLFYAMPAIGNPHSRPMPLPVRQSLLRRHIRHPHRGRRLRRAALRRPHVAPAARRRSHARVAHRQLLEDPLSRAARRMAGAAAAFREASARRQARVAICRRPASDRRSCRCSSRATTSTSASVARSASIGARRAPRARAAPPLAVVALRRSGRWLRAYSSRPTSRATTCRSSKSRPATASASIPDGCSVPTAAAPRSGLRLCFSRYAAAQELDEGVRRLARAWDVYRREARAPAQHAMTHYARSTPAARPF